MAGWDEGGVHFTDQGLGTEQPAEGEHELFQEKQKMVSFLRQFREKNTFVYRDALKRQTNLGEYHVEVALDDLRAFDPRLDDALWNQPNKLVPMFERAASEVARADALRDGTSPEEADQRCSDFQVVLQSKALPMSIRDLLSNYVSKLVQVCGIVISASRTRTKATMLTIVCRQCKHTKTLHVKPGFGGAMLPRRCGRDTNATDQGAMNDACPMDPYIVYSDKCLYQDQQTLKLQEPPENVPTGEMPRHILVTVDRALVGRVVPGMRVTVTGIYSIFNANTKRTTAGSVAIRNPYLRALGIAVDDARSGRVSTSFTPEQEERFRELSRTPDLYGKIAKSVAPAIYGHEDIKRAIACLLIGGAAKRLPDGLKLRGDINVLLLGDPSLGKSQFLKFVEKVAPVAVYTSGKGSSAAGLTASVIRDPSSREFYLEGGAMVLADGGVVCIDEFDKMREQDRVAIHEAMEQQTISIAKAGITTILNSRTAVLAAANPIFGRFDDLRSAADNIDFQTTILSRFDLIFVIRDVHDPQRDRDLAHHVLNLHVRGGGSNRDAPAAAGAVPAFAGSARRDDQAADPDMIDLNTLKSYIAFARSRCSPRLSEQATKLLENQYVKFRQDARAPSGGQGAIPITVRQLEAIVRISESQAKLRLSPVATEQDVTEAMRLFKASTLAAAAQGHSVTTTMSPQLREQVEAAEKAIKSLVGIGMQRPVTQIQDELRRFKMSDAVIARAVSILVGNGEFQERSSGKNLYRLQ